MSKCNGDCFYCSHTDCDNSDPKPVNAIEVAQRMENSQHKRKKAPAPTGTKEKMFIK